MLPLLFLLLSLVLSSPGTSVAAEGKVHLRLEFSSAALSRGGGTGLEVIAEIDRGWHVQAHQPSEKFLIPTELTVEAPPGIRLDPPRYPRPDTAEFAFASGKRLLVYEGKLGISTALYVPADWAGREARVAARLRYQACNDESCLPPMTAAVEQVVPVASEASAAEPEAREGARPATPVEGVADVGRWVGEYGYGVSFLLIALLGLGLNLTPCVYPLISVTVSFFGGQSHGSPRRVLGLALLYVGGIAITFSVIGVAAAFSGGIFGAALQKPPVLIGIAALLVILALSSFGLYQLQPPPSVMRLVGGSSRGALGALFMGLTMGVVAAPCVGPIVLGLIVFVGSRQDPILGFSMFFALSLGLGLPYVALAVGAGSLRSLPRSGEWLAWTEHLFGWILLALAAYFLTPVLPHAAGVFVLPAVIGIAGLVLGFVDPAGSRLRHFPVLKRAVGVLFLAIAVWAGVPRPVQSAIQWRVYSQEVLAAARHAGAPVVLDFAAQWCLPCKEMDHTTFADPRVAAAAESFHMVRVDLTDENDDTDALTDAYDVHGVPTTIILDASGREVKRMVGYVKTDEMLEAMRAAHASS